MRDGAVGGGAARVHRRASLRMAVNGRSGASLCGNKARFEALVDSAWGEAALES